MVRFGYGDADQPPRFVEVDAKVDGGLSKRPVENSSEEEARCSLPGGREIKVRTGVNARFSNALQRWSVWVDKIQVISGQLFDPAPFAVIINGDHFTTCRFQLSEEQSLYSLTQLSSASVPIQCRSQTQISGARDLIEYPIHPLPKAEVGSILITSAIDAHLCESMVPEGPIRREDGLVLDQIGTLVTEADWGEPTYVHGGATEHVFSKQLDLTNTGRPQIFYKVSSGHTLTQSFFVLPPVLTPLNDVVRELAIARDFHEMPSIARKKGWIVLGEGANNVVPFDYAVIQGGQGTYLYGAPQEAGDTEFGLWKGRPDGTMQNVCSFQLVQPHL
jgi:hypothetical protein